MGTAARDYDDTFERYGWLLEPGSPPADTLVEPQTEITRHYVGISTVPPPGKDSVANKGFEATLHLQQVPASAGGPGDVLVEAVMQTFTRSPRQAGDDRAGLSLAPAPRAGPQLPPN